MTVAITCENLSKQYRIGELHRQTSFREALAQMFTGLGRKGDERNNTIWALRDVSFDVDQGEVVGIIGRNGAGKSTLLKVLSRITHPTHGSVKVVGRAAALLEVGTGFHSELTGRENVYLNGSILGMSKKEIDAQFDDIVSFAGVERFVDTPIKRYSSGMELRLGFAVAAHLSPDVMFVDEVLAVGDAEFQKKCLNAMADLRSGGRTVLFVSHNMAAIENLCARAIWIDQGQIKQDGPAKEVIRNYLATFAETGGASYDLTDVRARIGTGEVRFTGLEFLDAEGQVRNMIRSGDSIVFRMHYQAHKRVQNAHFGVDLYSALGTMITSVNTWSAGFEIPPLEPGRGHVDVQIDSLPVLPGDYHLTLWLASVGGDYDKLDYCAHMSVEPADVFGTGRGMDRMFGIIYLPGQWDFHRATETVQEGGEPQSQD